MKKILYTLSLLLIVQFSQAQINNELKTWIQQSFTHYPKLKELEKTTELGEIRIDVAQSNYLPNINGTASYSYVNPVSQKTFGAPGAESLLQFQPHNNYNFNVGLNQVLWDFGKTQAQIEKAKTELLITKQNTEVAKLQLATHVTSIYYSMIYLQKSIQLQDTVIGFYTENKKILCTGGWGNHFNTSPLAHAVYSKAYLRKKGIPEHAFIELALSANTVEDAVKSKIILSRLDNPGITIITSDFHLERVKLIFNEVLKGFEFQFKAVHSDFLDSKEREKLVAHEQAGIRTIIQNGLYFQE